MTKLCARGKSAAKRKFRVYPSAYANAYASKICAGKAKDPSGLKRKDFKGPKPAGKKIGGEAKGKINKVIGGLKKASKLHAAQAKSLETVKANTGKVITKRNTKTIEELKKETQKIIDNFPKEKKYNYTKASQMTDSQKRSAVTRKRQAGNSGGKPNNISTFTKRYYGGMIDT